MTQHTDDHVPHRGIRPRFKIESELSAAQIEILLKENLSKENSDCKGSVNPGFATILMPEAEQHYWSPQLGLTYEKEESKTVIRGVYGPRPTVWTMFVFFYAIIGFAILIVGMIGLSHLSLDKPASILWLVPVLSVILLTLYLVAKFGQKMGQQQMQTLHKFTEEALGFEIREDD